MKHCVTCKKEQPLENFYHNRKAKDGLCYRCKDCYRESGRRLGARMRRQTYSRLWYQRNKEKALESREKWRKAHPDYFSNWRKRESSKEKMRIHWTKYNQSKKSEYRSSYLQKTYGISLKEYEDMLQKQNGVCALCDKVEIGNRVLAVDHCHETGKIRGLLCQSCNTGLGHLGDTVASITKALQYLSK